MKHLGDITKINGSAAPPVNVIIGGSPCQDLSVAGKRAGLAGERSGLFMEQIRIIKEMREASERSGANDIKPRYMVWENVPGAFSSNKGQDFRAVLEETARIAEKDLPDIPVPSEGWHYSGLFMGAGWSIAWRVFDAQFWGVPQRRRRIALVADFGGYAAPEILFERKGVFGDSPPGGTSWKDFAAVATKRFAKSDSRRNDLEKNVVIFNGETVTSKVNASNPKDGDPCHTLGATGAERCYCIQGNAIDRADTAGCNGKGWREDKSYTLNTVDRPAVYDARGNGDGETAPTITGDHEKRVTDYTGILCNCAGFKAKAGAKAHGIGYEEEKCPTLSSEQRDAAVCGFPLGFRSEDVRTYDETATTLCNGTRAGFCNGIINALCARDYKGVGNQYVDEGKLIIQSNACVAYAAFKANMGGKAHGIGYEKQKSPTLSAQKNDASVVIHSTVRRLTPLECERLQGFPDGWTNIGTEYIGTDGKKRKVSDSARYKALGNSIALPSWVWVLERLSYFCGGDRSMASLFDGIGGFPLIWETLNGEGTCLWASEIEEFPIAVTKYHFNH